MALTLDDSEIAVLGAGGFVLRDGVLGELARPAAEEAAAIAASGVLRPAGIGRERRQERAIRGDAIAWLEREACGPALSALWTCFEELRRALDEGAYLALRGFEVQLACYPGDGARYARHRDALSGSDARVATAVYYLNPAWQPACGGALRLHTPEGPVDVEPRLDRLVLFLSDRLEHEVLPVLAERLAITAWYRRDLLPPATTVRSF